MLAAADNHLGASPMPSSAAVLPRHGTETWKDAPTDLAGFCNGGDFPRCILWSGVVLEPNPRLLIEGDSRENALF